jgi:hypothetical protein
MQAAYQNVWQELGIVDLISVSCQSQKRLAIAGEKDLLVTEDGEYSSEKVA